MSGKIGSTFYCSVCDLKLENEADFSSHCKGKKHKVNERIRSEQEAASCSLLVRGAKGCSNVEQFLASYFCQFGLLAKVYSLGPEGNGSTCVQYVSADAVKKALQAGTVQHYCGFKLQVYKFEYKPHHGDAFLLSQKEELQRQEVAKENLYAKICQFLDEKKSLIEVTDQIQAITRKFQLTQRDLLCRQTIADKVREVLEPTNTGCSVYQFGSSMNGFGMQGCDLDLFLNLARAVSAQNTKLRILAKALSSRSLSRIFTDVFHVPSMRCPIIKFTHKPTGIKCDLSLNNKKALLNSQLLRLYSKDLRVRQMIFVLRLWAKFRRLSRTSPSSEAPLLSNYALTLLALFYLMQSKPEPVLPAVCDLQNCVPGITVETVEECECLVIPDEAELPPSKNFKSSVELLFGFFEFYSQEIDLERDALLLREGKTSPRANLGQHFHYANCRIGAFTVIDPFNLSHNVAANVSVNIRQRLVSEMRLAAEMSLEWTMSSLLHMARGTVPRKLPDLFEMALPDVNKKPAYNEENKKEDTTTREAGASKLKNKAMPASTPKEKPTVPMLGEQENGEFHIILSISKSTLNSKELVEAARQRGVTPKQHWLCMARDFTCKVLKEVFLAKVEVKQDEADSCETQMEIENDVVPGGKGKSLKKKRTSQTVSVGGETDTGEKPRLGDEMDLSIENEEMPKKKKCCESLSKSVPSSFPNVSTIPETSLSGIAPCSPTPPTATTSCADSMRLTSATSPSKPVKTPASNNTCVTSAAAKQMSLLCMCRHEVWHGRKKLREKLLEHSDIDICAVTSLAIEKELTKRALMQQASYIAAQKSPIEHTTEKQKMDHYVLQQGQGAKKCEGNTENISDCYSGDRQSCHQSNKTNINVSGAITSTVPENDGTRTAASTEENAVVEMGGCNVAVAPEDVTTSSNGASALSTSGKNAITDEVKNVKTSGDGEIPGKNADNCIATSRGNKIKDESEGYENGISQKEKTGQSKNSGNPVPTSQDSVATGRNNDKSTGSSGGNATKGKSKNKKAASHVDCVISSENDDIAAAFVDIESLEAASKVRDTSQPTVTQKKSVTPDKKDANSTSSVCYKSTTHDDASKVRDTSQSTATQRRSVSPDKKDANSTSSVSYKSTTRVDDASKVKDTLQSTATQRRSVSPDKKDANSTSSVSYKSTTRVDDASKVRDISQSTVTHRKSVTPDKKDANSTSSVSYKSTTHDDASTVRDTSQSTATQRKSVSPDKKDANSTSSVSYKSTTHVYDKNATTLVNQTAESKTGDNGVATTQTAHPFTGTSVGNTALMANGGNPCNIPDAHKSNIGTKTDAAGLDVMIAHQNLLSLADKKTLSNSTSSASSNNNSPEFFLEFSCDLVMNSGDVGEKEADGGASSPPHLLIKLRPSQSCRGQFKTFYDPFRSIMLKLNASELNVTKIS